MTINPNEPTLYRDVAYRMARDLTVRYSSSFSLGCRFFAAEFRLHIYAIYGLVRIADEIVDTYQGSDAGRLLDGLEDETYRAIRTSYSPNPIVHAFALTARQYDIDPATIKAFFRSMRLDLTPQTYTPQLYLTYIHGSAEVVGLMCLSVFCDRNATRYQQLKLGAMALGAAYQKVNFLRDIASDYQQRQRFYFPGHSYADFDEEAKLAVINDISADFAAAQEAIALLPDSSRRAVAISYALYARLLEKLRTTPIEAIKAGRIRLSTPAKLWLAAGAVLKGGA